MIKSNSAAVVWAVLLGWQWHRVAVGAREKSNPAANPSATSGNRNQNLHQPEAFSTRVTWRKYQSAHRSKTTLRLLTYPSRPRHIPAKATSRRRPLNATYRLSSCMACRLFVLLSSVCGRHCRWLARLQSVLFAPCHTHSPPLPTFTRPSPIWT